MEADMYWQLPREPRACKYMKFKQRLMGTCMRVCEVTWEREESKRDQYPGRIILLDNEGKLNEDAVCTCMCSLACVANDARAIQLNLAG